VLLTDNQPSICIWFLVIQSRLKSTQDNLLTNISSNENYVKSALAIQQNWFQLWWLYSNNFKMGAFCLFHFSQWKYWTTGLRFKYQAISLFGTSNFVS